MDYPKLIREYREKKFISQADLAKILKVSSITVNRWENGHFEPTLRCKRELIKLFKKSHMVEE